MAALALAGITGMYLRQVTKIGLLGLPSLSARSPTRPLPSDYSGFGIDVARRLSRFEAPTTECRWRRRHDCDEASNDTNADAFTADKRPVGA